MKTTAIRKKINEYNKTTAPHRERLRALVKDWKKAQKDAEEAAGRLEYAEREAALDRAGAIERELTDIKNTLAARRPKFDTRSLR